MKQFVKGHGMIGQFNIAAYLLLMFTFFSCDSIDEDLPACEVNLTFSYDYNMKFHDLFSAQVSNLDVFVFDKSGKYLCRFSDEGEHLSSASYKLPISLSNGEYQIVTWAGLKGGNYEIPDLVAGETKLSDLTLKMKRNSSSISDVKLEPLFWGEPQTITIDNNKALSYHVPLIKDTKTIKLVLKKNGGGYDLEKDDCHFQIIADNGLYDWNNNLLADDDISFEPYPTSYGDELTVEFSIMRIMENRKLDILITRKSDGKVMLDFDLHKILLELKLDQYDIPDQEFFDRQDEYPITLGYDPDKIAFTGIYIVINGWTKWIRFEDL